MMIELTIQIIAEVRSSNGSVCGVPMSHREMSIDTATPRNHADSFQTIWFCVSVLPSK